MLAAAVALGRRLVVQQNDALMSFGKPTSAGVPVTECLGAGTACVENFLCLCRVGLSSPVQMGELAASTTDFRPVEASACGGSALNVAGNAGRVILPFGQVRSAVTSFSGGSAVCDF
ncbi:hypothetical protein R1sor_012219 [Riccia sorocarpa]|uniref:Uncharacterized protein n=1 Tax=Riccia sorocarpa TaxID=122646 RepID=A0ABD3I359_9MARC